MDDTLVIRCGDPRYCEPEFLAPLPKGYTHTLPGCALQLVHNRSAVEELFCLVDMLRQVGFDFTSVALIDHLSCKAYKTDDRFETHVQNLRLARHILHRARRFRADMNYLLRLHDMTNQFLMPVEIVPAHVTPILALS